MIEMKGNIKITEKTTESEAIELIEQAIYELWNTHDIEVDLTFMTQKALDMKEDKQLE